MAEKKLRGLLDRAQATIGGLLGDFPQGFNAGAVAGVAGYPGDIAFMLDTAGRAITGQDTQPAAQDFPGITDYIAAKAGYPIPGSFSGQLGAAVGGLMTPGPGDLAKFAPVLSAIPFWHGSPHKYDAVDLSKIGTGEGAQAYGWGYYGADAKAVAEQYAQFNRAELANGNVIDPGPFDPEFGAIDALRASDGNYDSAKKALIDKQSRQQVDLSPEIAALESLQAKGAKPLDKNLYRGEYRWPDPAKEAATPLTGEDLLQWDRPLSEQPPQVIAALRNSKNKHVQGMLAYAEAPYSDPSIAAEPKTMGEAYRLMSMNFSGRTSADNPKAAKLLNAAGIPGIRYLDGMSRDGGQGTYNIVMFDEKGIKLLERNGSPIEDFAARRAGKAKPYREATNGM